MNNEIGWCEGEVCNRNGCDGVMEKIDDGRGCTCFIVSPCSHCVDMLFECNKCGETTEE